jgi:hypothetical protein
LPWVSSESGSWGGEAGSGGAGYGKGNGSGSDSRADSRSDSRANSKEEKGGPPSLCSFWGECPSAAHGLCDRLPPAWRELSPGHFVSCLGV